MGEYNPHAPRVIGQEWAPIREENIGFSPAVNVYEIGHQFTLSSPTVLQDGRFYINTLPDSLAAGQVFMVSVYPAGQEAESGPVRSVIIPCNGGSITGVGSSTIIQPAGTTFADALADPSDQKYIISSSGNTGNIAAYFAVNQYAQLLQGKRIVGVNLLYNIGDTTTAPAGGGVPTDAVNFYLANDFINRQLGSTGIPFGGGNLFGTSGWNSATVTIDPAGDKLPAPITRKIPLGEIDHFWSAVNDPWSTTERLPWTLDGLLRFEATNPARKFVLINLAGSNILVHYLALEVLYCEEKRVAYGGATFGYEQSPYTGTGNIDKPYVSGANSVTMRTPLSLTANPVLPAGRYSVVVSSAAVGNLAQFALFPGAVAASAYPLLNALREDYTLTSHPGVQVNITQTSGKVFTREVTHKLPQISLHTSGGPLLDVHVYGRQAVAQIYGSLTATQEIYDARAGGAASFPQVRFIARRFGDTTVPLTLDCPAIPASTASITPATFDALSEIVDGWKMVDLTFASPPSMGTGTAPQWRWSAAGETAGNRWEILGAVAPALSGIPGNLLNLVPSPHQLSIATYGQPVSGGQIDLGWIPAYAPPVSAIVDDPTSDAFIMFSMDMPPVTGFTVVQATQPVTGIGQQCGIDPCGIPSGIFYSSISWAATSAGIPPSGFGYYELQRSDAVDSSWATIMKSTSPTGSSFKDFEARVGILTSYRIRAVDYYGFTGQWSSTVTITLQAPGVTGGCVAAGHTLIFTSNERQGGDVNLAYSTAWEGSGTRVEEDFTFPEASQVSLQTMFNRDDFVAFHPTERGGVQFQRTLLVQAAAIAAPTLPDFRNLRDLAWASLSYVCVRDEGGNRWFANILVPSGKVMNSRKLYLASVSISEVTQTPSQVSA